MLLAQPLYLGCLPLAPSGPARFLSAVGDRLAIFPLLVGSPARLSLGGVWWWVPSLQWPRSAASRRRHQWVSRSWHWTMGGVQKTDACACLLTGVLAPYPSQRGVLAPCISPESRWRPHGNCTPVKRSVFSLPSDTRPWVLPVGVSAICAFDAPVSP